MVVMHEKARSGGKRTGAVLSLVKKWNALGWALGLVLLALILWMGCAEERVSPSAPPFQPEYFLSSVDASPGQVGVGGVSSVISALIVDRDDNPAVGVAVVFEAEQWGTISEDVLTDSTGVARAVFTSGSREGLARITAHIGAFSKSTVVLIGQGSLEASPSIMLANGVESSIITAKVISMAGQPDSGTVVAFQTTAGSITPRGVTDAAGVVKATLTTTASETDISAIVTARVDTGAPQAEALEPFGLTLVTFKGVTLEVDAAPTSIPADGSTEATLTASLKETSSLVPIFGEFVRFATSKGVAVGESQTDDRGHATSQLTSSLDPGNARVIASYGNTLSDTLEVTFSSLSLGLSSTPASVIGDGVSQVEIEALLKDLNDLALSDRVIEFDTNMGTVTERDTTGSSGSAGAVFTAPVASEDMTAVITAASLGVTQILEIQVRGLSIRVEADPDSLIADGGSQAQISITLVETTSGEPRASELINISTNLGSIDSSAVTNSSGVAVATFHGGVSTGTATITAEYGGGLRATALVDVVSATVGSLSLSCLPAAIFADGFNSAQVRAVVKDPDNRAVPEGMIVHFYTSAGVIMGQSFTVSGAATALLTSGTEVMSNVQVVAVCCGVADTAYVDFIPGVPAAMLLEVSPDSIPADGTTTANLVATVQDSIGHPVTDGTLVIFQIIVDIADTAAADTVVVRAATVNGIAATTYTAATRAGLAIVTATAGGVQNQATLMLAASGVSSILLSTNRPSVTVQGVGGIETAMIRAEVRDKNGNPVAEGTEVAFEIINGPGGPLEENLNNQGWGPVSIPTANGRASVTLNSGHFSGVVGISAYCGGIEARDGEITIDSGPPDTLALAFNYGLVAEGGDGVYNLVISALVEDVYGNPVENGTAVYWELYPNRPGIIIEGSSTTGNEVNCNQNWPTPPMKGIARTCLSYTSADVFDSIAVWAHTTNGPHEILVTTRCVLPIVAAELSISAYPSGLDLNVGQFTTTITVMLLDKYKNRIEGGVVDFFSDSVYGTCDPATAITNDNGICATTMTLRDDTPSMKMAVIARLRGTTAETSRDVDIMGIDE